MWDSEISVKIKGKPIPVQDNTTRIWFHPWISHALGKSQDNLGAQFERRGLEGLSGPAIAHFSHLITLSSSSDNLSLKPDTPC